MILIIGGAYQGKEAFALEELKIEKSAIFNNLHLKIKQVMAAEGDVEALLGEAMGYSAVICCEVGCGIVPMDAFENSWREATGRAMCALAAKAEQVWRVTCGLGVRLK